MVAAFLPIELSPPSDQIVIVNMCSDMIGPSCSSPNPIDTRLTPLHGRRGVVVALRCARFAYNWGLHLVKQRLDQRAPA